jgi:hypothetical protein
MTSLNGYFTVLLFPYPYIKSNMMLHFKKNEYCSLKGVHLLTIDLQMAVALVLSLSALSY